MEEMSSLYTIRLCSMRRYSALPVTRMKVFDEGKGGFSANICSICTSGNKEWKQQFDRYSSRDQ